MKPAGFGTSRESWTVLGTVGVLLVLGMAPGATAGEGETPGGTAPAHQEAGGPPERSPAAGMVIYRDPLTGRLAVPPPGVVTGAAPAPRGMRERQGLTRGGGVLLDGVPPASMNATSDGTGGTSVHCDPAGSEP